MRSATKRGKVLLTVVLAASASGLAAGRAEAQWGMGMGGMGMGFWGGGLMPRIQQPGNFVNQVAIARMGHVGGPVRNNVYLNRPDAYYNRVRDNGFVDRYSPDRRDPSYYGRPAPPRAAPPSPSSTPAPTATAPPARPLVPINSFFNDRRQLVWPGDSPTTDDLKAKRDAVNKACLAVKEEVEKKGMASVATVSEARQDLLDYGRPALKYVRVHETPRVADSFHIFLRSLYDSLAQAALLDPSA